MVTPNASESQPAAPAPATPLESVGMDNAQRPFHIRVHVRAGIRGQWIIECNHPVPRCADLMPHLPQNARDTINYHGYATYNLNDVMVNLMAICTPTQLQEALVAAVKERLLGTLEPTEITAFNDPAYLAVAGTLYKLQPMEQIRTNGALRGLRKRALAESKVQAARIIEDANTSAASIISTANKRLQEANSALEAMRASGKIEPPAWVTSHGHAYPISRQYSDPYWCVSKAITISFTELYFKWEELGPIVGTGTSLHREPSTWKWKKWHARVAPPFEVRIWVKLNNPQGDYVQTGVYIDRGSCQLPHIDHRHACMGLSDAPKRIASHTEFEALGESIARCMHVVDYSSPLVPAYSWEDRVRAFWPAPLMKALLNREDYITVLKDLKADEEGTLDLEKESSETWAA